MHLVDNLAYVAAVNAVDVTFNVAVEGEHASLSEYEVVEVHTLAVTERVCARRYVYPGEGAVEERVGSGNGAEEHAVDIEFVIDIGNTLAIVEYEVNAYVGPFLGVNGAGGSNLVAAHNDRTVALNVEERRITTGRAGFGVLEIESVRSKTCLGSFYVKGEGESVAGVLSLVIYEVTYYGETSVRMREVVAEAGAGTGVLLKVSDDREVAVAGTVRASLGESLESEESTGVVSTLVSGATVSVGSIEGTYVSSLDIVYLLTAKRAGVGNDTVIVVFGATGSGCQELAGERCGMSTCVDVRGVAVIIVRIGDSGIICVAVKCIKVGCKAEGEGLTCTYVAVINVYFNVIKELVSVDRVEECTVEVARGGNVNLLLTTVYGHGNGIIGSVIAALEHIEVEGDLHTVGYGELGRGDLYGLALGEVILGLSNL